MTETLFLLNGERPLSSIVGISFEQKSPGYYSLQVGYFVQPVTVCNISKIYVCGWP